MLVERNHQAQRKNYKQSKGTAVIDLSYVTKPMVNDINEVIKGTPEVAEDKEGGKAAKKILKTLENPTDTASKKDVIVERLVDEQGKLTSTVYKLCH